MKKTLFSLLFALPFILYSQTSANLFFSEYAEGSSNNKYFEIYNPTADTVDLSKIAPISIPRVNKKEHLLLLKA